MAQPASLPGVPQPHSYPYSSSSPSSLSSSSYISASEANDLVPSLLTGAVALGLIAADWSYQIRWEIRLLQARARWRAAHVAYFCARIGGAAFALAAVLVHVVGEGPMGHDRCVGARKASVAATMLATGGATAILLLRCGALWRFNLIVMLPLLALWLVRPIVFIIDLVEVDDDSYGNGLWQCSYPSLGLPPKILLLPWFALPAFDTVVLILTMIGLQRASGMRGATAKTMRRDNIVYYFGSLLSSLPIPILYAVHRLPAVLAFININTAIVTILSCRIFVNLSKAITKELAFCATTTMPTALSRIHGASGFDPATTYDDDVGTASGTWPDPGRTYDSHHHAPWPVNRLASHTGYDPSSRDTGADLDTGMMEGDAHPELAYAPTLPRARRLARWASLDSPASLFKAHGTSSSEPGRNWQPQQPRRRGVMYQEPPPLGLARVVRPPPSRSPERRVSGQTAFVLDEGMSQVRSMWM